MMTTDYGGHLGREFAERVQLVDATTVVPESTGHPQPIQRESGGQQANESGGRRAALPGARTPTAGR